MAVTSTARWDSGMPRVSSEGAQASGASPVCKEVLRSDRARLETSGATRKQSDRGAPPATAGIPEESTTPAPVLSGNSHVVTRGETLTSIAKQYRVGIEELQKFNHIENDRKLQIGQTLAIPGTPTPVPTATPAPATSPTE